jgi:hypothetical protein
LQKPVIETIAASENKEREEIEKEIYLIATNKSNS